MKLTVFTPTYNRSHLLGRLYESLLRQNVAGFEWVVVDDGSTDSTLDLLEKWRGEDKLILRYTTQAHGGKHRAVNRGLDMARGDIFMIVDSDDWLLDGAIEKVLSRYEELKDPKIVGFHFRNLRPDGSLIGDRLGGPELVTDNIEMRELMGISGDMVIILKTEDFRNSYRFPEYDGEFFVPEALVWNRISKTRKLLVIDDAIYVADYQPDGLSATIVENRRQSPRAVMTYYSELVHNRRLPFIRRVRAAINFWRFSKDEAFETSPKAIVGPSWIWLRPLGWVMKKRDQR